MALVMALLFAVSWQSFVTQTHEHFDPLQASGVRLVQSGDLAAGKQRHDAPSRLPDNCPICREAAHAGVALLPPVPQIVLPFVAAFEIASPVLLAPARVERSHIWRSRAPPILQA